MAHGSLLWKFGTNERSNSIRGALRLHAVPDMYIAVALTAVYSARNPYTALQYQSQRCRLDARFGMEIANLDFNFGAEPTHEYELLGHQPQSCNNAPSQLDQKKRRCSKLAESRNLDAMIGHRAQKNKIAT